MRPHGAAAQPTGPPDAQGGASEGAAAAAPPACAAARRRGPPIALGLHAGSAACAGKGGDSSTRLRAGSRRRTHLDS
eukprot:scaffold1897_cov129-Isochrysis_galbana.AAC.5